MRRRLTDLERRARALKPAVCPLCDGGARTRVLEQHRDAAGLTPSADDPAYDDQGRCRRCGGAAADTLVLYFYPPPGAGEQPPGDAHGADPASGG